MNKAYFAPLVTAPIVITGPGAYTTRAGEAVTVNASSMEHAFACIGTYDSGAVESWHRSGRLYVGHESPNDIVAAVPRAYRLHGMDFNVVAEYPDTEEGTKAANAYMQLNRDAGLLAVEGGRVIIAALNDKGTKP